MRYSSKRILLCHTHVGHSQQTGHERVNISGLALSRLPARDVFQGPEKERTNQLALIPCPIHVGNGEARRKPWGPQLHQTSGSGLHFKSIPFRFGQTLPNRSPSRQWAETLRHAALHASLISTISSEYKSMNKGYFSIMIG